LGGILDADPVIRETAKYIANWGVYPEFHTGRDSASRQSKPLRHETRVEWDGQNIMQVLHTLYENYPEFRNDVDGAMSVALSEEFRELLFPPVQDGLFQLRMKLRGLARQLSAADLSDGTIRFLYLLAILANPEPPPLIAIDEPETGLHPVMQHIVAEFAVDAASRTQVVLTTHSPEFLDCFGDTVPTTTVVEWQEGQGTTLRNLSGEALTEWVKHFSLGEILRTGEAAIIETEEEG
jgi:predicted ATPase